MRELVEFLLARIAEDEADARDRAADAMVGTRWKHYPEDAYVEVQSLTLARSRRVLAECEAKRRIVNRARGWLDEEPDGTSSDAIARDLLGHVVRSMALPHADHPDYRDEWRL